MRTLYIECNMGAAGDMLMAALLELHPDPDTVLAKLNGLQLPGVSIAREPSVKCGIRGTHVSVTVRGEEEDSHGAHHHEHHHHSDLGDVQSIIEALDLPQAVRTHALEVYRSIAEAEAYVHGTTVEQIHFHEVGTLDAIADVVGVSLLMYELAPEKVIVSPVHAGSGQVRCAHGILPVPTPAAAWLLRGVPTYGGAIRGELCTPTGAALLTHFADSFGPMPVMCVQAIGCGMGKKDFEAANCVRIMLGEAAEPSTNDRIVKLECNLDDMTGESLGFATKRLLEAGARDVYLTPIQMKKNRPGQMLSCICAPDDADRLAQLMFRHTTTLGVRRQDMARYTLDRRIETVPTTLGSVRVKYSEGFGVRRAKPEFADLEAISVREGMSLEEIHRAVEREI